MDLPTYTNIWRIEKRLYKLYDLRLPMPLPIVWIGVFVGVLAPWSLLLWLVGISFETPWHVLYLVPPGVVTWLSTRPVIESKRLTELLQSQLRYMGEPRSWCRLTPSGEPESVTFSGRVWRAAPAPVRIKARAGARRRQAVPVVDKAREVRPAVAAAAAAAARAPVAEPATLRRGLSGATGRGTAPALTAETTLRQTASPDSGVRQSEPATRQPALPGPSVRQAASSALPVRQSASAEPVAESHEAAAAARLGELLDASHGSRRGTAKGESVVEVSEGAPQKESAQGVVEVRDNSRLADAPTVDEAPAPASRWGSRSEPSESRAPSPAKPIGTEALRRLRRLAATADAPGPSDPTPPALITPEPLGTAPAAPEPASLLEPVKAGRSEAAGPEAAGPEVAGSEVAGSEVIGSEVAASTASPSEVAEAEAVESVEIVDVAQAEDQARDQHRKGQPPRTAAVVLPASPRVWPPTPSSKPRTPPSISPSRPAPADRQDGPAQPMSPATPSPKASPMTPPARPPAMTPPRTTPPKATPPKATPPKATPATGTPATDTPAKTAAELPKAQPPPLTIRAVPAAAAPANPGAAVPGPRNETRVRRVESVVGRDSSGGWRRLAQVVVGGGGSRTDGSEIDEARTRAVFGGSRRVVVLGCTGGAGQSTTALMLGHTFAHYRDDRVLAVDASTGGTTLTSRIKVDSPETLTSLLSGLDQISGYLSMRAFTTRTGSGLEVVAADTDIGAEQRLADRTLYSDHRLGQAMRLLDHHYKLAVIDPAPALAARVLPYADQLVLVVPASEDAAEAVAMTYEWLDGHGCADLRRRAVMVVNGVSRRSMTDVEQAEAVARGRCRAIVRVPWEDDLAQGGTEPVEPGRLRPAGRRAYLALAGVVVAGFASAQSTRPSEEEVAQ
ncbi:hypothetical protein GCM10010404_25490 [Nonomuraea africana]|uniref:MinD-like ATPase involved in chromosome partitioning or flagellar assembly n=1 Tax=Nonomuraea africana TaxID=46171 RepID=A0ABR9KMX4_9ACTN|nr:TcpE family conjugal transfer membrane protein [Nonomuraea africana]MBE1563369.1 MinD-like ATPase involved in chromosome partitioning or flagellar assembly [Nonomuraea africana]